MKHLLRKGQMSPSFVFSLYTCIFMDMILISAFKSLIKIQKKTKIGTFLFRFISYCQLKFKEMRESKENVSCRLYRHSLPFAYFRLQKAIPILSAKQKLMKMAVFIEFKKPAKTKDVDTPHINLF